MDLETKTLSLNKFCYKSLTQSPEMFYLYTGLNKGRLGVNIVKHKIKPATKLLTQKDHVLVVLMKLKLALLIRDIAYRFKVQLLPLLAKSLLFTLIWPEKQALRKKLPKCFRCFLSRGWGGRVSDKEITIKSGFLDLVEYGDMVLADELATRGAFLKILEFTRGKDQMSAADVDRSRQIANVRIHIERVIGRLRKFMILNTTIPITQVDLLDKVMMVVCALVNISKGIV
ncbi:uncharacterized protein LOC130629521 [Hydractinia symbiolongicarpus]|uniref:uncharacterized protein LOC130629521 n=1 Tax=Hydractinia symbiolongicarpus TaxID=13093 RepID=UPI00254C6B63|nr:uncharacterized protein LOC130629521 [Hydractinia symbiolongicarpus]